MIQLIICTAALALSPAEADLEAKLPEIFAKSAAHYKALDAAVMPLAVSDTFAYENKEKSKLRTPHTWLKGADGKGAYDMRSIYWWTAGHLPGSLWYLYEATGDAALKDRALFWTERLAPNATADTNHDIGFIMYCSFGNARRILKTKKYDDLLVQTGRTLARRFVPEVGVIRSWGNVGDREHCLVIPDNLMNLELLESAGGGQTKVKTGEKEMTFDEIARSHADMTMKNHFRADGGCYHVLDYDQRPAFAGAVQEIRRGQGLGCGTAWSRGQSWAIYGYTMMYRLTGQRRYFDFAKKLAEYAMNHPNMPADGIPYWDYGAPGEERDSSAGAVMASALLELSQYMDAADRVRCRAFAVKQLTALASPAYFSEGNEIGHFLLKHGTGFKPGNGEIDVALDYGDYYFLEALLRFKRILAAERAVARVAERLPVQAGLPDDEFQRRTRSRTRSADEKTMFADAERYCSEPIPDPTDELYWEYVKNGNRTHYERVFFELLRRLDALAAAEAHERQGRFLSKIEDYLNVFCSMKSWILPAHEKERNGNLEGRLQSVDLFSSEVSANLACVYRLVGARLSPAIRSRLVAECERRIFAPLRRELPLRRTQGADDFTAKGVDYQWWIDGDNNWNAVCWDNVLCAAFGFLDDARDRAYFTDAALKSLPRYLSGFTPDGYCSEGIGYWNYGFGHHMCMAKLLRSLTDGEFDILTTPIQKAVGEYAAKYSLVSGISPAFADGNGAPTAQNLAFCEEFWPGSTKNDARFDEFPDGQVWLFRDPTGLSVAFKGGHNGEFHNHNDLGSYYLMNGDKVVSGDPGCETYTRRTFSPDHRYESKVLCSYGHPVPVIGGQLQAVGSEHRAIVVSKTIADDVSEVVLELKGGYDVPTLTSFTRTFRYERTARRFTVTDRIRCSAPTAFEDAYIVFKEASKPFLGLGFRAEVRASAPVTEREERIENPGQISPTRVGISFNKPVTEAEVTFTFTQL